MTTIKKILGVFGIAAVCVLAMSACSSTEKDEYAAFRGKPPAGIFTGGERAMAHDEYGDAIKYFEALDAVDPFGPYAEQSRLDIIYAYYMHDDDDSALTAADRYIHLYPRSHNVDYAYYMRGIVGFKVGLSWLQKQITVDPAPRDISTMQQSFSAFATLEDTLPDSRYAPDALVRMSYIRNLLARREVQIAEFYMDREAYVAAANRATYVVQHFNGTPEVIPALAIQVKADRALGLDALANASNAILQANYPNSPEAIALR